MKRISKGRDNSRKCRTPREVVVLVREDNVKWTREYGDTMRQVWASPIGQTLLKVCDMYIIGRILDGAEKERIAGMKEMLAKLVQWQSPKEIAETMPESTTMQFLTDEP